MPRSPVLAPPALDFTAQGRPRSIAFDDIYHGAAGAGRQSRHVFLAGTGLPGRWRGCCQFSVLETGFGFGINFLCTWQAWRDDPDRCESLHFVSVEKHPPRIADLESVHRLEPGLETLAVELRAKWPMALAGVHRLVFEGGRVTLTLSLGDVSEALPALRLRADAFFLDGFAPDRNPAMWSAEVMRDLARRAAAGSTLATWCSAGMVRRSLEQSGFEIERRPGDGGKFETSVGRFAPRWRVRRIEPPEPATITERRAAVIGAGIAGCAVAHALCERGWHVHLLDRGPGVATGASGNRAGIFHPVIGTDDGVQARLSRAAFLLALDRWRALQESGHRFDWSPCGVLQVGARIDCAGYPSRYARATDANEGAALSGVPTLDGGPFYEQGGWVSPRSLAQALQNACGERLRISYEWDASALERDGKTWNIKNSSGSSIGKAPIVVFATGHSAIPGQSALVTRPLPGVVSHLSPSVANGLRCVLLGNGFVTPAVEGALVAGATYEPEGQPRLSENEAHAANLATASRLLGRTIASQVMGGRVGSRAVTHDRLPAIGPLLDETALRALGRKATGLHLQETPRLPGLYCALGFGSRGLLWSALGAELLVDMIEGRPRCIEASLVDAIDPGRFALRQARRRNSS